MTIYYTTHNDEAVDAAYDEWNDRTRGGAESWSFAMLDAFQAGASWQKALSAPGLSQADSRSNDKGEAL